MKISTRRFGEVEIDDTTVLSFPEGLPGFEAFHKFAVIEDPPNAPFCWLQSLEDSNISLIIINPFLFMPDYKIELKEAIKGKGWNGVSPEDIAIYVVVNVSKRESGTRITANLMGPLVINTKINEAVQLIISDSGYSHQHDVLARE